MTILDALKTLAAKLGADAGECKNKVEALNVISAAMGGESDATKTAEAIENIAAVAKQG